MATLQELQKQNQKLREEIREKTSLMEIGKERNRLLKENKALLINLKHSRKIAFLQGVGRTTEKAGKKIGRFGGRIWNTLAKMEQQRLRNEARHRSVRKTSVKKKKKRR